MSQDTRNLDYGVIRNAHVILQREIPHQYAKNQCPVHLTHALSEQDTGFVIWWSIWESNPRPLTCEASALPTELMPQINTTHYRRAGLNCQDQFALRLAVKVCSALGRLLSSEGYGPGSTLYRNWPTEWPPNQYSSLFENTV